MAVSQKVVQESKMEKTRIAAACRLSENSRSIRLDIRCLGQVNTASITDDVSEVKRLN